MATRPIRTSERYAPIVTQSRGAPGSTRPLVRALAWGSFRDQRLHRHDDRLVHPALVRRQQSDLGDRLDGGRLGPRAGGGAAHVPLPAGQRPGRLRGRVRHAPYWSQRLDAPVRTRRDGADLVLLDPRQDDVAPGPHHGGHRPRRRDLRGREGRRLPERLAQGGASDLRMYCGDGGELADVEGMARPATDGAGRTCRTARGGGRAGDGLKPDDRPRYERSSEGNFGAKSKTTAPSSV